MEKEEDCPCEHITSFPSRLSGNSFSISIFFVINQIKGLQNDV